MKICPVCVIMYYRVIFLLIEYYFEKKSILKISIMMKIWRLISREINKKKIYESKDINYDRKYNDAIG